MNAAVPPALIMRGLCFVVSVLLVVSCATRPKEAEDWNALTIWQQVSSTPPTYIPTGYAANRPRTDRDGTWFTDKRDGKRFFVPNQTVRGMTPGVLVGEAKKATGYDGRDHLTLRQKVYWGVLALFAGMADVKLPPPD